MFTFTVLTKTVAYTGRELRSGWIEANGGVTVQDLGTAVGFIGPCSVATEDLVDLDDARAGATIQSAEMAHVIVEHRDCPLATAVLRQRLLVCILAEVLAENGLQVRRDGDDLYVDDRKLTVSIAAPTVSHGAMIHLGVNVRPDGAPVPAVGLAEFAVDPRELLQEVLGRYADELAGVAHAETKVRTVE